MPRGRPPAAKARRGWPAGRASHAALRAPRRRSGEPSARGFLVARRGLVVSTDRSRRQAPRGQSSWRLAGDRRRWVDAAGDPPRRLAVRGPDGRTLASARERGRLPGAGLGSPGDQTGGRATGRLGPLCRRLAPDGRRRGLAPRRRVRRGAGGGRTRPGDRLPAVRARARGGPRRAGVVPLRSLARARRRLAEAVTGNRPTGSRGADYDPAMDDLRATLAGFDPDAPLASAPDPWEPLPMPAVRSGPPWAMTESIAAQPAIAARIADRIIADGSAERLADAIRGAAQARERVVVTGCGTSEHAALAVADVLRDAYRAAGHGGPEPVAAQAF